jgi:hypothetical protein
MRHDDPPAGSTRGRTVIDVLEPHDVVLAEIAADLHLDQLQQDLAGIGEAVHRADRHIGGFVLVIEAHVLADRDLGDPVPPPSARSGGSASAATAARRGSRRCA